MNPKVNKNRYLGRKKPKRTMNAQALKLDLIHWLTELQDQATLTQLQALKEQQAYGLSEAHQQLLDGRIAFYEQHPDQVLDWDSVSDEIEQSL